MPRTVLPLHHPVQPAEIEHPRVRLRINLFDRRREDEIHARRFQQFQVGLLRAGIIFEILRVIELRGIDEDAHHRRVARAAALSHQRQVPCMQSAHRGHEPDRAPESCELRRPPAKFHPQYA